MDVYIYLYICIYVLSLLFMVILEKPLDLTKHLATGMKFKGCC